MALPVPRGGHAGGRADGQWKVQRKQAEHGRAVHCNATAYGPVRGGQSEGGREGADEVVEPGGNRLGDGESKGGETDSTSGSGTDTDGEEEREEERETRARRAGPAGRNGAEQVQMSGGESKIDIKCYIGQSLVTG